MNSGSSACRAPTPTRCVRSTRAPIDKCPGNFLYLGLAALLFPDARVIEVRRDPRDALFSCFRTNFGPLRCAFSTDLDDLASYHDDYERLMRHWRALLPVTEVRYEELVRDPEHVARELVDSLGLEWEPRCLDPRLSELPTYTASAGQVDQPVHTRSIGRWRAYASELAPLVEAVDALERSD